MLSRLLLPFSFLALFSSCGKVSQIESKLQHEAGLSTPSVIPALWTEVTREEHENNIKTLSYSENHPMTKRVQFWLNALDEAMRSRYPSQMSVVPVPKASVLYDDDIDAFVRSTIICLDVDVVLEGYEKEQVNPFLGVVYSQSTLVTIPNKMKCLSTDKVKDFLVYINQKNASSNGCQMKFDGERVIVSKLCNNDEFVENSHGLYVLSSSNFVSVTDNLMKQLSEKELVAALAHELAHYYRSHISAEDFIEFFYKIEKNNLTSRPVTNAIYKDLGQELLQIGYLEDYRFRPIERHPTLGTFYLIMKYNSYFIKQCETNKCKIDCANFYKNPKTDMRFESNVKIISKMGISQLDDNETLFVTDLEQKFNTCTSHFSLDENGIAKQTISYANIDELMKKLPLFSKTISHENIVSFKEYIDLYSSDFDSTNAKIKNKVEDIKKQRLGYYTFEQEADELGAEMLSFINIDPRNGIDLMLSFSKIIKQNPILWSDYSYEKCKALKDNDWKDTDGVDVFIPFGGAYTKGNFATHPSSCYRAWNYDREIKAHNYVINSSLEPVPPSGSYADILKTFRKYTNVRIW